MKTYKEFITEVGDSRRPYKYRYSLLNKQIAGWNDPDIHGKTFHYEGTAKFNTDQNIDYFAYLNISPEPRRDNKFSYECDVVFKTGRMQYSVVDLGLSHAFRVMATVIAITKQHIQTVWKKHGVKTEFITFDSANEAKSGQPDEYKKGDQRNKLYLAFIKKEIPGAKPEKDPMGMIRVKIPERHYK